MRTNSTRQPRDDGQQATVNKTRTQSNVCQNTNPSSTKPEEKQPENENGFQISKRSYRSATTAIAPLCGTFEAKSNASPAESSKNKLITDGGSTRSRDETPQAESVARDAIAVIERAADNVREEDNLNDLSDWLEQQADELQHRLENTTVAVCCGNNLTRNDDRCPNCGTAVEEIIETGVECDDCGVLLISEGAWIIDGEWYCPTCRRKHINDNHTEGATQDA